MQRSGLRLNAQSLAATSMRVVRLILQNCTRIHWDVASVFRESMVRLSKPLPG
jgi:hypothetical protein